MEMSDSLTCILTIVDDGTKTFRRDTFLLGDRLDRLVEVDQDVFM